MGSTNALRQMRPQFGSIVGFLVGKCPWARTQLSFIFALCGPDMATLSVSWGWDKVALCLRNRRSFGLTPGPMGKAGVLLR